MYKTIILFFAFIMEAPILPSQSSGLKPTPDEVQFCSVVAHPISYSGKTVKLTATLTGGMEFQIFEDNACPATVNPNTGKSDVIEAMFNEGHYDAKPAVRKRLEKLLKKRHQAKVTVIGAFIDPGKYVGHQLCCRYQLNVEQLISVE